MSLLCILIEPVVNNLIALSISKYILPHDLCNLAFASKSVCNQLCKFMAFKLVILEMHLLYKLSKDINGTNPFGCLIHLVTETVQYQDQINIIYGQLNCLRIFKSEETLPNFNEKMEIVKKDPIISYFGHSLMADLEYAIIYSIDCRESYKRIKCQRWIFFGDPFIVKEKARKVEEFVNEFGYSCIRAVSY